MTSRDLIAALERRHTGDIFVSECKNGPTHSASHRRMDGWALLKTWSPVTSIGYEVKVTRSDWLRDEKIATYLPLCHLLYIVAPKGIVKLEELPPNVGLLEPVGDGKRLVAKRKAARREVDLPTDLFVYILMCRTKITRETIDSKEARMAMLQAWLDDSEARRTLGHHVKGKIRTRFDEQLRRQEALDHRCQQLEGVKRRIEELGFDPEKPVREWEISQRMGEAASVISSALMRELISAELGLKNVRERLQGIRDAGKAA